MGTQNNKNSAWNTFGHLGKFVWNKKGERVMRIFQEAWKKKAAWFDNIFPRGSRF